jgi:hypothetical protein
MATGIGVTALTDSSTHVNTTLHLETGVASPAFVACMWKEKFAEGLSKQL